MKELRIKVLERLYQVLTFHLFEKTIEILQQRTELSKDELHKLLRDLPNQTSSVVLEVSDNGKKTVGMIENIGDEFTYEFFDENLTYKNFIEAFIGQSFSKVSTDGKAYPTPFKIAEVVIQPLERLYSDWGRMCTFSNHIVKFSLYDIGMNVLTIQREGYTECQYTLKWTCDKGFEKLKVA